MLLLVPFLNIYDIIQFFIGTLLSHAHAPKASIFLKFTKDLLFIFLFILGFLAIFHRKRLYFDRLYYCILILFCLSIAFSFVFSHSVKQFVSGVRWFEPILLIPFIRKTVDLKFQERMGKILLILFWINFGVQIIEFFFIKSFYFGMNSLGLSTRNPGLFIIPSTAAFFIISVAFYVFNFMKFGQRGKMAYSFIFLSAILLTASGTGIVVFILLLFCELYVKVKEKGTIFLLAIGGGLLGFIILPVVTSRSDIYMSIVIRAGLLFNSLSLKDLVISPGFGLASNSAVQLRVAHAFIADSLYTSLISNIGFIALIFFLVYLFRSRKVGITNKKFLEFILINLLFGISTIVFEAYPMNLLFALNLAYFQNMQNFDAMSEPQTSLAIN